MSDVKENDDNSRAEKRRQYNLKYNEKNREKRNAYAAQYRKDNKELIAQQQEAWARKNAESRAKYNAEYAKANAEKIKEQKRLKYLQNRESALKKRAEHYAANPEKVRIQVAKWRAENPGKTRIFHQNRRARKQLSGGILSRGLGKKLMFLQRGKCACCKCDLVRAGYHLDHIEPLAIGGPHVDANIQLLCPSCNLSKQAKHPIDFMQSRGYLL